MNRIEQGNKFDDKKVTGLLMVASSAINIPFDRLRPVPENSMPHPSGDSEKYSKAVQQFEQLWNLNFVGSCLCPDNEMEYWKIAELKDIQSDPDGWRAEYDGINKEKKVKSILKIIRNALAHGNLYTKGPKIIEEILFISTLNKSEICDKCKRPIFKTVDHYNCISVTPYAFEQFLKHWFQFISELEIPTNISNYGEDVTIYAIG